MATLEYQTVDTDTIKACPEQTILNLRIAPNEVLSKFDIALSLLNNETGLLGALQKGAVTSNDPEYPKYNSGWEWNTSSASKSYEWISITLENKYSLSSIKITADNPGTGIYARLKISNGYSWYQVPPFEKININTNSILSEVIADKVLLEFYTISGTIETKASLKVTTIVINTKYHPADLKLKLYNTEVPIQRSGDYYSVQNLVQIINDFREKNAMPEKVTLMLSSSIQGRVKISYALGNLLIKSEQDVKKRVVRLPSSPSLSPKQGPIVAAFLLEEGTLEELEFTLKTKLLQQKALYGTDKALDYSNDPRHFQFCSRDYGFAQIFQHSIEPLILIGIDLFLIPLTQTISGTLTLQKDYDQRPLEREKIIAKLPIKIDTEPNRPFKPEWFYFELPDPVVIGTDEVTCIMSLEQGEGELLWAVSNNRSFYKIKSNPWLEGDTFDTNYSGIRFHVRSDETIRSKVMVCLQKDTLENKIITLNPDDRGNYSTSEIKDYNRFDILVSTEFGGSAEIDTIKIFYSKNLSLE